MNCEASCKPWKHWRTGKMIYQECSNRASVTIDGVNLCLTHAGTLAVRKLINEGLAERIKYESKSSYNKLCSLDRF